MTNQTVTGSRLTGYIVNVMRFPVIERLMIRGSQVAIKHVIHDMVTRTLLMELRRRAIKRWVPCGDMDRRLKIPHSAKVECGFRTTPEECNAMQCNAMQCNAMQCNAMQCNAMQCNAMQCNAMQCNTIQYNTIHLFTIF